MYPEIAAEPAMADILQEMRRVIQAEAVGLTALANGLDANHIKAVEILANMQGRVILVGVGKSGHIARKAAATFASTGTPAQFVHGTEASHGDLGMLGTNDVCITISNSGETSELADLVNFTRRFAIPLIAITKSATSTLGAVADVTLLLPDEPEACAIGVAPTTSTTASLALCDALAVALMVQRGFQQEDFQMLHPGGKLGAALLRVDDIMHKGSALPLLARKTPMPEGLLAMTAAGFGIAGVIGDDDTLIGIITDGDLRRNMNGLLQMNVEQVATPRPKTIGTGTLVSEALNFVNSHKITAVFVIDGGGKVAGLVHIHDLLRAGVK